MSQPLCTICFRDYARYVPSRRRIVSRKIKKISRGGKNNEGGKEKLFEIVALLRKLIAFIRS